MSVLDCQAIAAGENTTEARLAEIDARETARVDRLMVGLEAAIVAAGPDATPYEVGRSGLGAVEQMLQLLSMRWPSEDLAAARNMLARSLDAFDAARLRETGRVTFLLHIIAGFASGVLVAVSLPEVPNWRRACLIVAMFLTALVVAS